ncbi:carbohydrate ABC transporter substrate-binding protein [bacterium]|uniref:carbohydrate ABC transporter substrate-binding protein n=1 Tax=Gemmiger sp. TaxID=2049027 RepID=UPI002A919DC4|nr:carbohydrate ABC transporter substrate-binding protein [Gemmiger sp.]MCI5556748.1 carbohydrate ABC transporter substrate-binding protein [bacterium]MCI6082934.1 carbohydrate ABC transporter substrate-binding protein [bacterium]MCI6885379.1 carbohydrate ABC transporter substrate-binding protein [bacterium]MCI7192527.1 carbohydrate ABC transporter substrate-binding protein [bacterium]MCI7794335.1 carbohydrate ABC transporter substrate-binding protein [bacterium]
MKKTLALLTATGMALTMLAGCGGGSSSTAASSEAASSEAVSSEAASSEAAPAAEEGQILNIWCWNDEFQSRFNDYYPGVKEVAADKSTTTLDNGITVKWTINPNENNNYQNKLDEALLKQDSAADDDKIDIFLIEADYALKYVDSPYTMDVKELGLTDADLADQYQYTKDIVTVDGVQKGTTWQATPGLFAYRRSIAKDVLGTDDPAEVQEALSDWDKFNAVAEQAAAKGYKMLSGYDDSYRTFSNNVSAGWVDGTTVKVDPNIMSWVDQTKTYTDKGYNNKTSLWSDGWAADQGPDGKVFGFFYSTWGINFTLLGNSLETPTSEGGKEEVGNGIYGDYAVCQGPQPYYWGGTWICAATGTDNAATVCDVMKQLTCNADIMKQITIDTQDYTNSQSAMNAIAEDPDFGSDFLGGQNHIALFAEVAPTIDMSNAGPYDQGCNETFQSCMKDYFDGAVDLETAKANFEDQIKVKYPELTAVEWPAAE